MQAHESRRAFLSSLLLRLLEGPLSDDQRLAAAFLQVEGSAAADSTAAGAEAGAAARLERARASAKQVLAVRRESLALWGAYAALEAANGQRKVTFHLGSLCACPSSCHADSGNAACVQDNSD